MPKNVVRRSVNNGDDRQKESGLTQAQIDRANRAVASANREIGKAIFSFAVNRPEGTIRIRDGITGAYMTYEHFQQQRNALVSKYKLLQQSGATQSNNGGRPVTSQKPTSTQRPSGGKPVKHSAFIQGMLDYYGEVDMHDVRIQAKGRN